MNYLKVNLIFSVIFEIHKANAWIRWFVKCSNCFCLCDDETDSDRYISLREVVSNLERNRYEFFMVREMWKRHEFKNDYSFTE